MLKKTFQTLFMIGTLLLFSLSLLASEPSAFFRGVRPLGMGGAFVAISDDQNAFFYNPAGLAQRDDWLLTLFEMPITLSDDMFAFYNWVSDNRDQLEKFDEQSTDTQTRLMNEIFDKVTRYRVHLTMGFPNINFITTPSGSKNKVCWGAGIFDLVDVRVKINGGILVPTIDMWGSVDAVGIVPIAVKYDRAPFDLPGSLAIGGNIKYIYRGRVEENRISVLEVSEFDPAFQKGSGYGLDFGTLYQLNDQWNFGLMIADIFGTKIDYEAVTSVGREKPATTAVIPPRVDVGVAFKPQNLYYWKNKFFSLNKHITFACDVTDITDENEKLIGETFFNKLHLGAEWKMKMLSFRGGFNQGYPTLGVGLSFWFLRLDYAMYGDELGKYPGQIPEWNHMLNLAFRF